MKQTSLSAGAVLIRFKDHQAEYLILRSFKYWDFPKGMVEAGEDPWQAALREVTEETGLSDLSSPFGKVFKETQPYGKGKVARYYILQCNFDSEVKLIPNPITGIIEHHGYRWVSFQEANNLLPPRVKIILKWANDFVKNHS